MVADKVYIHCSFKEFDNCFDGGVKGRGLTQTYFVTHLRKHHFHSDSQIASYRELIGKDLDFFNAVDFALCQVEHWLYGDCMNIHSLHKHCKHANGKYFSPPLYEFDESISCYIRGISPPSRIISSVVDPPNTESTAQPRVLDASTLDKVFQCSFHTVKSIPHSYRFAFSRALNNILAAIVSNPSSCDAWVRLFILPACTLRVFIPRECQEKRFGNRKALQQKYILNALTTWSELGGPSKLLDTFFEEMSRSPSLKLDENPKRDNVKHCLRKISNGHYSVAIKVLTSSGVAHDTPEAKLLLEDKDPYASPPTLPSSPCGEDFLLINDEVVHNCTNYFPKGTYYGRDGLRAQHLLDALCGAESTMAKELLSNLTPIVNLWL